MRRRNARIASPAEATPSGKRTPSERHERADRERCLFAQEAHRLVPASHREERALLRAHRERPHDVAGDRRDVIRGMPPRVPIRNSSGPGIHRPVLVVLIDEPSWRSAVRSRCVVGRVRSARRREIGDRRTVLAGGGDRAAAARGRAGDRLGSRNAAVELVSTIWTLGRRGHPACAQPPALRTPAAAMSVAGCVGAHHDEGSTMIDKTCGLGGRGGLPDIRRRRVARRWAGSGFSATRSSLIEALLRAGHQRPQHREQQLRRRRLGPRASC